MTRIITTDADNLSNRTADGGIQPSGPRGAVTQYTSGAEIIPFPSGRTFLPDSHASERELFLRDLVVIGFVCITAAWAGCMVGAGIYIGKLIVAYLSGGAEPIQH